MAWLIIGGGILFTLITWWAKGHLSEANGTPSVPADPMWPVDTQIVPGVDLGMVEIRCLWCMEPTLQVAQAELFADRDPITCRSCGRPVWFLSQDNHGKWFIS